MQSMKEHFESRVNAKRLARFSFSTGDSYDCLGALVHSSPCSFAGATLRGRAGTRSPPLLGEGPANPAHGLWLGRPPSRERGTPC
eukprot:4092532-Amphidinium_carterae.1